MNTLKNGRTDFYRRCTASHSDTCWLLCNLSPWNRILHFVDIEIKEDSPGRLTLQSIDVEILMAFSADSVIRAALTIYLLMKNHRCIERLNLVNDVVSRRYPFLLLRGLYFNRGLRHLKLSSSPTPKMFGDDLSAALKRIPTLESLEIGKIRLSRNAAGIIADMMQKNSSLTKVSFMENEISEAGTLALLGSLTCNKVLETLCIDDSRLEIRGAETLSRLLCTSQTIKELSVKYIANLNDELFMSIVRPLKLNGTLQKIEFSGGSLTIKAMEHLAKVLKLNKSLQFLHVVDCNIRHHHAKTLSEILECNETLLEMHLQGNSLGDKGAEELVRGIENNSTLRVLRLDSNNFGTGGIKSLATALKSNTTLRKLILGHFDCHSEDESRLLTQTFRKTNVLDRMQLSYDLSGFQEFVSSLKTTEYPTTEVNIDASLELDGKHLKALFRVLITLQSVETVIVEAPVLIDDAVAVKVSKFLSTCQTVKHFHLNTTNAEASAFPILITGLKKNMSIERVEMEYCAQNGYSALAFFDLLKENRKISYFSYLKTNMEYLRMLPNEMASNYTLTTLRVYEEANFKGALLEVYEKLRRNLFVVDRAVGFALNHCVDRRMAEAYERLCDVKYLQEHLMDVRGMTEVQVESTMRSARKFIIEHYLPITRIVKKCVVCHEAAGQTQIDQLDYHAWLHIFSYLKVCDVIDR
ncbi:NLR family CARD domain-containing protein 3-like isoform X2 [Ornithodoros turicata]